MEIRPIYKTIIRTIATYGGSISKTIIRTIAANGKIIANVNWGIIRIERAIPQQF
jgi:hypothetical protein